MDVVKRLKPMMAELELEDNILIISHQATLRYQVSELWILILIILNTLSQYPISFDDQWLITQLDPHDFGFLDPQKYADPDPRGKISTKNSKKNFFTPKTKI